MVGSSSIWASGPNPSLVIRSLSRSSLADLSRDNLIVKNHTQNYREIISTSSYLFPNITKKFEEKFNFRLLSCYGITEAGGPLTLQNWEDTFIVNNVGSHSPEVEFKSSNDNKPNKAFEPIQFLPYQALSSPLNTNTLTGNEVLIFFSFKFTKSKKPATTPARPSKLPPWGTESICDPTRI